MIITYVHVCDLALRSERSATNGDWFLFPAEEDQSSGPRGPAVRCHFAYVRRAEFSVEGDGQVGIFFLLRSDRRSMTE